MATVQELIEARPEDVGLSSARLARLAEVGQRHIDAGRIPGALTMVARRGKVVHFETRGSMDLEAGKPVAPDTIFRIYSMTKPVASVALMMLYEEGHFQLDDPVSRYIPGFAGLEVYESGPPESYTTRPAAREMSIRDVLTHTSGISSASLRPSPVPNPVGEIYRHQGVPGIPAEGTLRDTIERLAKLPLACDPGTHWIYSLSTDVVAYLCELFTGQSFDRVLRERIFDPLGMRDTAFYVDGVKLDRFSANYRPTEDWEGMALFDAPTTSQFASNGTYFSAVGGLTSTAPDYMRFAKMLANRGELDGERILGPRTLDLMTTNHLPDGADLASVAANPFGPSQTLPGTGFGLGFAVLTDPAGAHILGSRGEYYWSGAAGTQFFVSPRDELVVIFMTQLMLSLLPLGREVRVAAYQALVD